MTVRLTLHTDFALRVFIRVGLDDGKLTTIKDIAHIFDISKASLMKVVNDLSRNGYLHTVRGRNGGIRLMRKPRDINIGQVVRDTENQLDVINTSLSLTKLVLDRKFEQANWPVRKSIRKFAPKFSRYAQGRRTIAPSASGDPPAIAARSNG